MTSTSSVAFLSASKNAGREHVAVARDQRDQHAVGAAELRLVLHEGLHVLVLERQLLGERGVDVQAARRRPQPAPTVSSANTTTMSSAVAEDQLLERRRRA